MPEHFRALIVILALASLVFAIARTPVCAVATAAPDYLRRRNLWIAVTLAAFLPGSYWVYAAIAGLLLVATSERESNKLALFYLLLLAVPAIQAEIPGIGPIRYLLTLTHPRLLALTVLLPSFLSSIARAQREPVPNSLADKLLACYLLYGLGIQWVDDSLTNTLRSAFYAFVDVVLPYYVASRSIRTLADARDALAALVVAAMISAALGSFEFIRHWLLYASLPDALGQPWQFGHYLPRNDSLRAAAATGQPIVLGFVVMVALGGWLFLSRRMQWWHRLAGSALLGIGLVAPISRGPWVGAALLAVTFVATGPFAATRLLQAGTLAVASLPVIAATPAAQQVMDYLPFIGNVEADNVTYRQRLFDVALDVIGQHPLFGSPDFLETPELQQMRQGEGLIDIVNTYLGIALRSGLIGLALFCGFFAAVAGGLVTALRRHAGPQDELRWLGRSLLAMLVAMLATIATVSSISVVATIYWSIAGLIVAYGRLSVREGAC